jgi:hypothetical protein
MHTHCTHGRADADVSRQGQRRTPHTHTPCTHAMELESCQNPAHTQNVFCSRITIHTHTKRVLLTHNDSHTRSVWFANTKHHSQTNAFCFRNKYIMCYTYKETYFFNYKKISSKYELKSFSHYTTAGGAVPAKPHGFRTVSVRFSNFTARY